VDDGVLSTVLNLSTLVFAVTSMLSVGFSYTLREIIEPLRDVRGVLVALLANFFLVPLLAYAVTRLLTLEPAMEIGLILVSTAAGAPFLIKLTQLADGDLAFAGGLLVLHANCGAPHRAGCGGERDLHRHASRVDHASAAWHRPDR
jgi:BASS family bile acid:Na+ symporter